MTLTLPVDFAIAFVLVFARTGSMAMLLPVIGERFVQMMIRLVLALFISLLLLLPLKANFVRLIANGQSIIGLLLIEIFIGLAIGVIIRMVVLATEMTSQFIAQSLGLSLGEILNPTYESQSNTLGLFMSLLVVTFIFLTDSYQMVLAAFAGSYDTLPPGLTFEMSDISRLAVEAAGKGFLLAIKIAAPFFVFGLLFNSGLGIISKLMPQIQVTYLAVPLSVLAGFAILIVFLGSFIEQLTGEIVSILAQLTGG
jgi:flagellar biosynthetic protein FliR